MTKNVKAFWHKGSWPQSHKKKIVREIILIQDQNFRAAVTVVNADFKSN